MKKIFSGIIVMLILIGMLSAAFNIQTAKAIEPVYIRADGSIDPPEALIHRSGDLYTLAGNIGPCDSDGIVIERDNMVLDGAGYTVQGYAGSRFGVYLSERSNVTIENLQVNGFDDGVSVWYSSNVGIHGNTVTNNNYNGIYLYDSSYSNITSNNVVANYQNGILIDGSCSNVLANNIMTSNSWNFGVTTWNFSTYINYIDTSNTVDGKPVYYWINQKDAAIHSDAGYVALINCTRITVNGLNLTHNYDGLLLAYTTDSIISGNAIINNYYGLELEHSTGNTLSNNAMFYNQFNFRANNFIRDWEGFSSCYINYVDTSNTVDGKPVYYWINQKNLSVPSGAGFVALVNCTGITVKDMNITKNGSGALLAFTTNSTIEKSAIYNNYCGIWLESSFDNRVVENNIENDYADIWVWRYSSNNEVAGNNITNSMVDVYFENSPNNSVYGNYIAGASMTGLHIHNSSGISVHNNDFINNSRQVHFCHGASNNTIYHNNFISTTNQVTLLFSGFNFWDAGYPSGGNYWSDYSGIDQFRGVYQDEAGSDGIGDSPKPVFPNSSQIDRYPLMGSLGPTTITGENVTVFPAENVGLIFENVAASGSTSVSEIESGPAPESGFKIEGQYLEISTTASYSGSITIRMTYDDSGMTRQEEESLQLMHWNEITQQWENITTHVDTENNVIYGEANHLSIFAVHSLLIHDLSIFSVHAFKTIIGKGYALDIFVDVRNEGDFEETFDSTIDLVAGQISYLSIFAVHIVNGNTVTLHFTWNTVNSASDNYNIIAHVSQVPYEINTADNTYADGTVTLTIPGDVTGDFFVNIKDAALIGANWGKTVPPSPPEADINGDGIINIKDAAIAGVNWQKHA